MATRNFIGMKQLVIFYFFLILALTPGCGEGTSPEKVLMTVFSTYQEAILNKDGRLAVNQLDSRSLEHYNMLLERVNTWDKDRVQKLDIIEQATILMLRNRVDPALMLSFNARDFLIYAINNEYLGSEQVANFKFDQIQKFKGNRASAFIENTKDNSFSLFEFFKEEGVWKMNISKLLTDSKLKTLKGYQMRGYNPQEVLTTMMRAALQTEHIPDRLWIPLQELAKEN